MSLVRAEPGTAERSPRIGAPMSTRTAVRRKVRANRLDERYAVAIGLVSGAIAAFAGAAPTGSLWIDRCLVGIAVGVVTWASASAAWWALSMAAGVATVVAIDPALTAIGAVAFAGGLRIGVRRRDMGTERCLVGALSLNVLVRAELDRFFGASALIGITVAVVLFVVGIRRRPRAIRRVAWMSVGGLTILTVLAVTAFGVSGASARTELSRGQQLATDGIAELGRGNFAEAAAKLHRGCRQLQRRQPSARSAVGAAGASGAGRRPERRRCHRSRRRRGRQHGAARDVARPDRSRHAAHRRRSRRSRRDRGGGGAAAGCAGVAR